MNNDINTNDAPLKELPQGFDRSVIKSRANGMRDYRTKIYFSRCDFIPMENNGFRGWFAFPDIKCCSPHRRSDRIGKIVNAGGWCEFVLLDRRNSVDKSVKVRVVEAFMDRGNIVVRIEKVAETSVA